MEPAWVEHAIWWHVHPLGFVDAEPGSDGVEVTHRLGRLVDWLDYVVEIGTSGIALGPVFASATHGYDTLDYFRIDPRLGDDADFAELVAAAHDRGLRVLLDGVFNHAAPEFADHACFARTARRSRAIRASSRSTTTIRPFPTWSSR